MSVVYEWTVDRMDVILECDGRFDQVISVHWRVTATDGDVNTSFYGTTGVPFIDTQTYTPYNKLSQDIVIGWVKSILGDDRVNEIESSLSGEIGAILNPSAISKSLPWG